MAFPKSQIREFFRKRASRYDLEVWAFRLIGVREGRYRRDTVDALSLKPGDTVVDLACGTGLNFALLESAIKEQGRIIGVDMSEAMLDRARERVRTAGWRNVDLVQADLAEFEFPSEAGGILSTFAMYLVPEYDAVIRRGAGALRAGGRLAILDVKRSEHPPAWMDLFPAWKNRPFGVGPEYLERRPRESIRRHLQEVRFREYYFGYLYLSVGEAPNN